jgi:hypothetical protein
MPFQTRITRARFVLGPFTAEQMHSIGSVVLDSITSRIRKGLNIQDAPAKPLKPGRNGKRGYPDYKTARGLQPIRDWFWRGRTMRSMAVKAASENKVTIGFTDPHADMIAHVNNRREKQFGVSPKDRSVLARVVLATLRQAKSIRVRKAA